MQCSYSVYMVSACDGYVVVQVRRTADQTDDKGDGGKSGQGGEEGRAGNGRRRGA